MNKEPKRKYDYLETAKIINSLSPALEVVQRYNDIGNINTQLVNSIYPLLEVSYKLQEIIRPVNFNSVTESIMRMGELISNSLAVPNINMDNMIGITLALENMSSKINSIDKIIGFDALNVLRALEFNIPKLESEMLNNLAKLREFDWSQIDEESLEAKEVEDSLNEIVIDLNDTLNWQQKIMMSLARFKYKNPVLYILITLFIFGPMTSAISDGMIDLVKTTTIMVIQKTNGNSHRNIEKDIKSEVSNVVNTYIEYEDVEKLLLRNLRYVSVDELIVREGKRVSSRKVYTLGFGQVVKVLAKNKNWTLIEYKNENEDDEVIQGWVFTRYLSKFK